ncbi:MAG: hypothetical protein EA401_01175 [Planctomycetota bacterium]|nr:MAG: hypothetical protein EA401_01175 [Planctomycetota bacterium]
MTRLSFGLIALVLLTITSLSLPLSADEATTHEDGSVSHQTFRAAIWAPSRDVLPVIRGILFLGNGAGSDSRDSVHNPLLQEWAVQHGFVLVGMRGGNYCDDEHWNDFAPQLKTVIDAIARPELHHAPFLFWGHSNGGQQAYGMARRFPERAIAFIVNKGRGQRKGAGVDPFEVPALWISGIRDQDVRRENVLTMYEDGRANGAPWAFLEENGQGHGMGNSQHLAFAFFEEVLPLRYPLDRNNVPTANSAPTLVTLDQTEGWLVGGGHDDWSTGYMTIGPQAQFNGDPLSMGWVPTERAAILFRASGSYVTMRALQRNRRGKHIHVTGPIGAADRFHDTLAEAVRYEPGQPFTYEFSLERPPEWREIRIYDYDQLIHTIPASGDTSFSIDLMLDPSRPSHAIHAEMELNDGERRTSLVLFARARSPQP